MKNFLYFLLFFTLSNQVKAQKKPDTLAMFEIDQIIFSGTKTDRKISTLPLPAQIISKEDIEKTGFSRLNEIIQEQTGLITVPDFGGGEGIQMQGLDAAYVLVLIDGQPIIGRQAGTLDLSRISLHNVERIEIIKGASSCLYGSEALAGTINIITKKNYRDEKFRFNADYKIASFNTHDASSQISFGTKKVGVELFANYYQTDGYNLSDSEFSTVEPFHNYTLQGKINFKIFKNAEVTLNSKFFAQNQDYSSAISSVLYRGKSEINESGNAVNMDHKISDRLKMVYDFYWSGYKATEFLEDTEKNKIQEDFYDQQYFRPEVRFNYKIAGNTLTAGFGLTNENLSRTYMDEKAALNAQFFYAQYEWFLSKKWNLLGGFRYDHHQEYESQLSPKIGVNFNVTDHFSLKSSLGYGYKAPDFRQLYFAFTNSAVGYTVLGYNVAAQKLKELQDQGQILSTVADIRFNNDLKPESSVNMNFGGYYKKNKLKGDFNIYYNSFSNMIDTKVIAQKFSGQNVFSYFNLGEIFTYGAELNLLYQLSPELSVAAGYQYLQAKDKDAVSKFKNGEIYARDLETWDSYQLSAKNYFGLYNRSRNMVNFKIDYNIQPVKTSVSVRLLYRSKYGFSDTNGNSLLDEYDTFVKGYSTTNISATTHFNHGISIQYGANNLWDFTDPNSISNLPGRQLFAMVRYQF